MSIVDITAFIAPYTAINIYWALPLMLCVTIVLYFIGFLFGKKEPDVKEYFSVLFNAYENTGLRKFWAALLFSFFYIIGFIYFLLVKIAWYPAQWIRRFIKFLFYDGTKLEIDENRKKLKDRE